MKQTLKSNEEGMIVEKAIIGDNNNTYIVNLQIPKSENIKLEYLKLLLAEKAEKLRTKKRLLALYIQNTYIYETRGNKKKAKGT